MGRFTARLAILMVLLAAPVAGSAIQDHEVYLPAILQPAQCGPVQVLDYEGCEQDWDWLEQTFGAVRVEVGSGAACVTELRATRDDSTLLVRVVNPQGDPVGGVTTVFYWPDAPDLPSDLWGCFTCGVYAQTKQPPDPAAGTVGFGMGPGAYYWPPAGGPHTVWTGLAGSDCVHGLGMLGGTNHYHLNPTFQVR